MAKKNNKTNTYIIIGVIILLLLMFASKSTTDQVLTNTSGGGSSGGATGGTVSGGGGGGGGTPSSGQDSGVDTSWLDWFSDLFDFDFPNPFGGGIPTPECTTNEDCMNKCANPSTAHCVEYECSCAVITSTLKSNGESCTDSAQCTSGYCDLGNKAVGTCADLPVEPECSRNTDCDYKCATSNSGKCTNGICGCTNPASTPTTTCSDSDYGTLNWGSRVTSDINPFEKGNCQSSPSSRQVTDYCEHGKLIEYHCRTSTSCDAQTIDCTTYGSDYFCLDGMCTKLA